MSVLKTSPIPSSLRHPPAFQFYASDFLAEAVALSAVERGVLVSLKAALWVHRTLPFDPPLLARYLGLPVEEVAQGLTPSVVGHFMKRDGEITSLTDPELDGQLESMVKRRQAQSAGGRLTGNANKARRRGSQSGEFQSDNYHFAKSRSLSDSHEAKHDAQHYAPE